MYNLFDCFILTKNIPGDQFVAVGAVGTIIMVLDYSPPTYMVEFRMEDASILGDNEYIITEEYMAPWHGENSG